MENRSQSRGIPNLGSTNSRKEKHPKDTILRNSVVCLLESTEIELFLKPVRNIRKAGDMSNISLTISSK